MDRRQLPGSRPPVGALVRPALVVGGFLAAYYTLPLDGGSGAAGVVALGAGLVAVVALFAWHLRAAATSRHPVLRAVEAVGSTVALLLLLFSASYHVMELARSGSFTEHLSRTDALYYTLTVFSTVGLGDITPVSPRARVLTMVQMVAGLVFVALAGRLAVHAARGGVRRRPGPATATPPDGVPRPPD
ncbi:potassium channel family protein [Streptomyces kanasensis]|uniref:potassium channel family protein n=1 Tax=Streptomyces kanasensis TaxID=936756 RepID=UPI0036F69E0F